MTSDRRRFRADAQATIDAVTGVEEERLRRERIATGMLIAPNGSTGSLAHLLPLLWRGAARRRAPDGSDRRELPAERR